MTREECPKEYFDHLCDVVRAVFVAESRCRQKGVLTKETCKGNSTEWYCENVAEEMISRTSAEELTSNN